MSQERYQPIRILFEGRTLGEVLEVYGNILERVEETGTRLSTLSKRISGESEVTVVIQPQTEAQAMAVNEELGRLLAAVSALTPDPE